MSKAAKQQHDDEVLQWATFRLSDELYGVDVMKVREVLRFTEITPVPGAPKFLLGIINLRGNVVTVVDTRERFGLTQGEITDHSRIVIIESNNQVVGMLVDSVAEVVYLSRSEIENTPNVGNDETAKYIQGVCNKKDQLLILVELESMIDIEVGEDYDIY